MLEKSIEGLIPNTIQLRHQMGHRLVVQALRIEITDLDDSSASSYFEHSYSFGERSIAEARELWNLGMARD